MNKAKDAAAADGEAAEDYQGLKKFLGNYQSRATAKFVRSRVALSEFSVSQSDIRFMTRQIVGEGDWSIKLDIRGESECERCFRSTSDDELKCGDGVFYVING
ncbi:hypothetical protein Tco_1383515 [Tanacetum coccineum]